MSETSLPRPAELAALMSARLCHDLISPTSAIVSGVDLLEDPDSQDMREDAINLIAASSKKLGALLQFCRVAYGASASADTFDVRDLKALADGVYETTKADLDWAVEAESLNKPAARSILNLAQMGSSALPRGGTARLTVETEGDSQRLTLHAAGLRAGLRPEVILGLEGKPMDQGMAGHWVQAYYLYLLITDAGGAIGHEIAEESVRITVTLPA